MCANIGVDPLASNKGVWAQVLGFGDFYYELGVQIVEACMATRSINGGLMDMQSLMRYVAVSPHFHLFSLHCPGILFSMCTYRLYTISCVDVASAMDATLAHLHQAACSSASRSASGIPGRTWARQVVMKVCTGNKH